MRTLFFVVLFTLFWSITYAQQKIIYMHWGIEDKPITTVQLIVGHNPSKDLINVATVSRDSFPFGITSTYASISRELFNKLVLSVIADTIKQYEPLDNLNYGNIKITIIDKTLKIDVFIPSRHAPQILGLHLNFLNKNTKAYKLLNEMLSRIDIPLDKQPKSIENYYLEVARPKIENPSNHIFVHYDYLH